MERVSPPDVFEGVVTEAALTKVFTPEEEEEEEGGKDEGAAYDGAKDAAEAETT